MYWILFSCSFTACHHSMILTPSLMLSNKPELSQCKFKWPTQHGIQICNDEPGLFGQVSSHSVLSSISYHPTFGQLSVGDMRASSFFQGCGPILLFYNAIAAASSRFSSIFGQAFQKWIWLSQLQRLVQYVMFRMRQDAVSLAFLPLDRKPKLRQVGVRQSP